MSTDPVIVATVQGEFEEQALRTFLEAHGIPTIVRGEALRKTHAFVLDGLGAVEILVAPEHELEARDLEVSAELANHGVYMVPLNSSYTMRMQSNPYRKSVQLK